MAHANYLQRLTEQLTAGIARLPAGVRDRHGNYLLRQQLPDGAFPDREGGADLYYTGFGLRGLLVLDQLTLPISQRAGDYLQACLQRQTNVVDFYSLLYAALVVQTAGAPDIFAQSPPDWPERVAQTLESFRTADGGYAKGPNHPGGGSTYHSFLVALCYELLGRPLPRAEEVARFVLSRRRDDGGFVEVAPMRRSGTNPTAAAIGLLQLAEQAGVSGLLSADVRQGVIDHLVEAVGDDGGIRANARVPVSDLLSTFTAAWTLHQLGALDQLDRSALATFAEQVQARAGGFHGGLWDEGVDVEYTFYGLGVWGLVA